jgi:hypothetical protein
MPEPQSGHTITFNIDHMLTLPNSAGLASNSIGGRGFITSIFNITHCTLMADDTNYAGVVIGNQFVGHSGMFAALMDTLVWGRSAAATYGRILGQNYTFSYRAAVGTASSNGSTTTLNCAGCQFPTGTAQGLTASGAGVFLISGANTNTYRAITSNTSNQLSFAAATSTTTGDTFVINVPDLATSAAAINYNASYNGHAGSIYDQTGAGTPVTTKPYGELWLTHQDIGANDVALGTGTNEKTEGPKFVDSTRNFATYDNAVTGLAHANGTAWATSTVYAVGDIRSDSYASFYAGATINYRCVLAHTSAAGTEPGKGATCRTAWEFATAADIRADTSLIAALGTWVKAGFVVQNPVLKADHAGGWIGAEGGSVTATGGSLLLIRNKEK